MLNARIVSIFVYLHIQDFISNCSNIICQNKAMIKMAVIIFGDLKHTRVDELLNEYDICQSPG